MRCPALPSRAGRRSEERCLGQMPVAAATAAEPLCVCRPVSHPGAAVAGTPGQDGGGSGCARRGREELC
eukprot:COSAG01_NODE_66640_length_269_cov_0.917647_1_plen_68_part_01